MMTSLFPILAILLAGAPSAAGPSAPLRWPIVLTQIPAGARSDRPAWPPRIERPDGARIIVLEPGKPARILTPGFGSACDPCVSIDGKRILFAGKPRDGDRWDIFEIGADGSELRRITESLGNCLAPVYLARGAITAPEFRDKVRWIAFTTDVRGHGVEGGGARATALYIRSLEPVEGRGIVTWPATFNLSSDFSPEVLGDGRILFSSWQHFPGHLPPRGTVALLTISWSGEDLNLFCGNDDATLVRSMACEMPDRTIVYVESDGGTSDRSGRLARVSMRRPLRTREVIGEGPGRYRDPHPLPDGRLVVAFAPDGRDFGIVLFDVEGKVPAATIHDKPGWDDVDAQPIAARREPLGRITMVDDRASKATMTCLDVYDSDQPEVLAIPRGAVKGVRFIEGIPRGEDQGGPSSLRIIGEAPVEADGSFLVEIVPDTPFFLQIIDAEGMALATMPSWMGLRPRDERGCIGCHEDKEFSPINRVTEALWKADPSPVTAPPEARRVVDFDRAVAPIVRQRCGACHGADPPAGGIALAMDDPASARRTLETLRARAVPWKARESPLVLRIIGRKPNPGACVLEDPAERRRVIEWVDLGAPGEAEP
ncbi:MAG: hypothetical protein JXP34_00410 [Planctomycetes bacterium]|nr:hypothetical protein [Planctomycetota bacterium]